MIKVVLAQPRGFCAGVVRAIDIVDQALTKFGAPVYVRHEIVHNRHVVDNLKSKGAIFVEELNEVPEGAVTVFSAHGVARSVIREAKARSLPVLDATCPLVSKVHSQGKHYVTKGKTLILIGHAGHPEVEGTMGQIDGPVHLVQDAAEVAALDLPLDTPLAYVTQTTLSVDDTKDVIAALKARRTSPISATPPRTARRRCVIFARWWTPCWWWAPTTAPTPSAYAKSARRWESRAISSPTAARST
jgi:4-hydroxy-3-methylbut-2-enyl diphosphate reductase